MKHALAALLAVLMLLLAACVPAAQTEETVSPAPSGTHTLAPQGTGEPFVFTRDNFPRLNGSTSAVESGPLVHTDWSQLTPYQPFEAVEERWYEEYTDRLIPREDYGTLVPYAVPRSTYQLSWDDDGTLYTHQSYGFADRT